MLITYQVHQQGNFLTKLRFRASVLAVSLFALLFLFPSTISASNLEGRILLQVEEKGEAWYVNPLDSSRLYLARPHNAFELMRSLGLGASDKDIGLYQRSKAPTRLSGRILLQVQDKGQAFYVNPLDLKLYYLGRPDDALYLMRSLALGVSNEDLFKIKISKLNKFTPDSGNSEFKSTTKEFNSSYQEDFIQIYTFRFRDEDFSVKLPLSTALYEEYKNSQKSISLSSHLQESVRRETFYAYFLNTKAGDNAVEALISQANKKAKERNWNRELTLDFLLALIQQIPYDHDKVVEGSNANPFFSIRNSLFK